MHLRFPLPAGYFPKFELTPNETMAFQGVVNDIVKETRRDQLHFLRDGKMNVDARTWKLAKSKERLHVYRKRMAGGAGGNQLGLYGVTESSSLSRSDSESSQDGYTRSRRGIPTRTSSSASVTSSRGSVSFDQEGLAGMTLSEEPSRKSIEPTVLGFGLIEGSVDDIIYGLHESSTEEMKTMASFLGNDSLIDCAVLHTLRLTKSTYLGLKWKLTRSLGGNRDVCFVEYVGIAVDAKGERYGYHVLESVPVGNCPPFADNSIVRTNMSFCYLFRESSQPGLVDVFMEGAFDSSADVLTAGGVGDNRSAMEMLFGLSTAFLAAEAKKLSSLVAKQSRQPVTKSGGSHCSICRAKPGMLSSHLVCQGCGGVICTKCRVKKQTFSRKGKIKISCCKICLVNVKDTSPFEGLTFEKQPLNAIKKKPEAAMLPPAPVHLTHMGDHPVPPLSNRPPPVMIAPFHQQPQQQQKLQRHNSNSSATDTEYSNSIQSWPSSSISSTYSDVDDSSYYPTLQQTPEHGSVLVAMDRKLPGADGPGYGFQPQHPQQYQHQQPQQHLSRDQHHHPQRHQHHSQQDQHQLHPQQDQHQLARYGAQQNQLVAQNQNQMHYLPNTQQLSSHMTPLNGHHQSRGYAPQQQQHAPQQQQYYQQQQYQQPMAPAMGGAPAPRSNGDQSRAGLYNQMLELQMAAERAYNMANQNATYLHQQQR